MSRAPWVMQQRWHDLLFVHWPVRLEDLRPLVPGVLTIDQRDASAWIGVIPFYMTSVRMRGLPAIPTATSFAEINVRTYVTYRGRPGVWFFSLDAESTLAVIGARIGAHLPYYKAKIETRTDDQWRTYRSDRTPSRHGSGATFDGSYRLMAAGQPPAAGSLEHFLAERYSLFAGDDSRLWRVDIEHAPWQLAESACEIRANTMIAAAGIPTPQRPPLVHFGGFQDVRFWWPRRVE